MSDGSTSAGLASVRFLACSRSRPVVWCARNAAVAAVHFQLGEFARRRGAKAEARDLLERALTMVADWQGPLQFRALIHNVIGLLDSAEGRLGSAREHQIMALTAALASWDAPVLATVVIGFSDLALREGDLELAAELLGAAEGMRGLPDRSWPETARIEGALLSAIGEQAFTGARGRGGRMAIKNVLERLGIEDGALNFTAATRAPELTPSPSHSRGSSADP